MSARLIQVIEVTAPRGRGTDEDPVRTIRQFWSAEGKLLAEDDPQSQGAMPRSQANTMAKNLELHRARADAMGRWLRDRLPLKPTPFKEAVGLMLDRLDREPGWRP